MARISDKDRAILGEVYKTVLDNFSQDEVSRIGRLAGELSIIIQDAKSRSPKEREETNMFLNPRKRKIRLE
jgi:hypothetical protein